MNIERIKLYHFPLTRSARVKWLLHELIGDGFTAADCVIGHNMMWGSLYGLCDNERLRRYVKTLSARPAYQAAFADRDQVTQTPG